IQANDLKTAEALPGNVLRRVFSLNTYYVSIPRSELGYTYVFTPRDDIRSLFTSFNKSLPEIFDRPFNESAVFKPNDTIPLEGVDLTATTHWAFEDNGIGHSFKSFPSYQGEDGTGWVQVELLLVRLNTTFTRNGEFQAYYPPEIQGFPAPIGYDAAVCVELFEPYVVGVYNNSNGIPESLMIIDKAKSIQPDKSTTREGNTLKGVKSELNSTGRYVAYEVLHDNSNNQIVKVELSPRYFAEAKAKADCSNLLPYLAGSGKSLAWSFEDRATSISRVYSSRHFH
ncbi:hypothetical protein MPER_12098, partial [Moniliophthora perniciosa FA553]